MSAACEKRPTLKKLLVESRPKRREGRPTKEEAETGYNVTSLPIKERGNSRAYLEDRLARDFPDHWRDYIDGTVELDPATVQGFWGVPFEHPKGLSHQPHIPATAASLPSW